MSYKFNIFSYPPKTKTEADVTKPIVKYKDDFL